MSGRLLHFDPCAGAAGDMLLAALCDLGTPSSTIDAALAAVGMGSVRLSLRREQRQGQSGLRAVFVDNTDQPIDPLERGAHDHAHDHAHAAHVPYRALRQRIEGSALVDAVRTLALRVYDLLAAAEAQVHGSTLDAVELHELGAPDTLADVVGIAAALHHLQPDRISVGSVPVGSGEVQTAHGVLPVPTPATALLLRGLPVHGVALRHETITPTGAAVLACVAQGTGAIPSGILRGVGVGLGHRDPPGRANLLRALLLDAVADASAASGDLVELQANLDDESGEVLAHVLHALLELGCVDAWATPAVMKKGRPASVLHALAPASVRDAACRLILAETSSLGLRLHAVERRLLERRLVEVHTRYGAVRVKLGLDGERVLKAKPEFADCQRLARQAAVPLRLVQEAARHALDVEEAP